MARIYRDAYGVPHIRATVGARPRPRAGAGSTARDRSWQLEYLRRRATGTAAEVLGARPLAWDVLARRTRMADTARRAFDGLGEETPRLRHGVRRGRQRRAARRRPRADRLGIEPAPWEPWTPLAVFHAQHLLFAALPDKLWHHRARAVLGTDEALLSRDPAYSSGSNAWAVGGARTAIRQAADRR